MGRKPWCARTRWCAPDALRTIKAVKPAAPRMRRATAGAFHREDVRSGWGGLLPLVEAVGLS